MGIDPIYLYSEDQGPLYKSFLQRDFVKAQVFYQTLSVRETVEEPTYTVTNSGYCSNRGA